MPLFSVPENACFSCFYGNPTMSRILSRILSCGNDYIASTVYKKVLVRSRQKEKRQNRESRFCLYMAQTPSHALPLIAMPEVEGWYAVVLAMCKSSVLTVGTFVISKSAAKIQHFFELCKYETYFFAFFLICHIYYANSPNQHVFMLSLLTRI